MAQSFSFADQTVALIQSLKQKFGVQTDAEAISRALSLAKLVTDKASPENIVVVVGEGEPVKLNITK